MRPVELARKRIFLRDKAGSREEMTLWLSVPYQKVTDGATNWHVDWGIIGLLDQARGLVGPTAFDALAVNLAGMKGYLKNFLKGREIIDADVEALIEQHPNAGLGTPVVTISELFGKL